jgi:hypothetical protein
MNITRVNGRQVHADYLEYKRKAECFDEAKAALQEALTALNYALPYVPKKKHVLQDYKDAACATCRIEDTLAKMEGRT